MNATTMDRADLLDSLKAIRRALHIGLASFGEVERLTDAAATLAICGTLIPDAMQPIHPTGCADTVGRFADALQRLEQLVPAIGDEVAS